MRRLTPRLQLTLWFFTLATVLRLAVWPVGLDAFHPYAPYGLGASSAKACNSARQ